MKITYVKIMVSSIYRAQHNGIMSDVWKFQSNFFATIATSSNILMLFVIMTSSLCLACGAGVGDTSEDLGDGYTYRSDGSNRWINPGESIYVEGIDGNILTYNYNQNYILAIQEPSRKYYRSHFSSMLIYKYSHMLYDSNAVKNANVQQKKFLNSQWWRDSTLRKSMAAYISPDNNNDNAKIESIVDSVIKNDPYYKHIFSRKLNYWIIKKRENELFGPFSKEEYLGKKRELGIPKELALEKE